MAELVAALALLIGPTPPAPPSLAWGDARHAWVGTGAGILASEDGGTTWVRQTRASGLALTAVDATHAWAIADQGQTVRTKDGVHWTYLGVQHLMRISFVDARDGFALDRDGIFLRTHDGGATWRSPWGFRLQSLCFSDARTGWVARNGTIWTTHDGGSRWTSRLLLRAPDGNPPVPELSCSGRDVWAMFTTGAAAGSEAYVVYRSRDAGATWHAVYAQFLLKGLPQIDAYAGPIAVVPGGGAALEGSCAACGRGRVSLLYRGRRSYFDGWAEGPVAFANARVGLLVLTRAQSYGIFRTRDGGRRWARVR